MADQSNYLQDLLRAVDQLNWEYVGEELRVLNGNQPNSRLARAWMAIRDEMVEGRNPRNLQIEGLKRSFQDYFAEDLSHAAPIRVFRPAASFLRLLYRNIRALDFGKSYFQCLENPSTNLYRREVEAIFADYEPQKIQLDWIKNHGNLKEIARGVRWPELLKKTPLEVFTRVFFATPGTCVLLLADSGYGKTTFLQKLFYDYALSYPSVALAFVYAGNTTLAQVSAIPNKPQTILFLDALDEDQEARRDLRRCIDRLSEVLKNFRQVIISTRVQLFRTQEEEWQYLDNNRRLIPLSLHAIQPLAYFERRLGKTSADYQAAAALEKRQPEIFKRPLFLSWIEDLLGLDAKRPLQYLSEIFSVLSEKWASREEAKVEGHLHQQRTYAQRLLAFSEELAIYQYRMGTDQLVPEPIADIAQRFGIAGQDSRDRSFLTRNRATDTWAFTHQSFFDYFLARALLSGRLREEEYNFKAYPATTDLYNEMCWLQVAKQDKVPMYKDRPSFWDQDDQFAHELVTLQPNWLMRALVFVHRDALASVAPFWQDLIQALRRLLPNAEHYVFKDHQIALDILAGKKQMEEEPSMYSLQFLREVHYQNLLAQAGLSAGIPTDNKLHFHLTPAQRAAWQQQAIVPETFTATLEGLLKLNPILRRAWQGLEQLSLSGLGLSAIPAELLQLKELRSLDLSGNQITEEDTRLKALLRLPELLELYMNGSPILQDWKGETNLRALREHYLFPPEMVIVEGGSFAMGLDSTILLYNDGKGNKEHSDNEQSVYQVVLADFWMATHPVTLGEFRRFVQETGYQTLAEKEGWSWSYDAETGEWEKIEGQNWQCNTKGTLQINDRHPVLHLSWYDALEYCNWLSRAAGLAEVYQIDYLNPDAHNLAENDDLKWTVKVNWETSGYRLPTEAEWEYAARERGRSVRFGNGQDIADPTQMNFDASSHYKIDYSIVGIYRAATVPADAFAPNALGIFNMSGNVAEWCWDWYANDYYQYSPLENPHGPAEDAYRVLRGGSWFYNTKYCRSSFRFSNLPAYRFSDFGFRVVLFPPPVSWPV
ncbi:formylglycine-generating enzyme family protein [Haliscomenobacter hydrossis]|uniref:Sulphatase-modifying factor protein n=1 Tax=Haliscomenobacter hydrossis (strain ATCC 27775 / DSM 1100 / LMG 10767 / O) TaxID=760192 RepID=F4KV07_HALH1|nr:formylglycine-generating enzyme family protein [Haliscomenobacter hydrossis]AEE49173.1 Sulphatase-modifying factor protein [Haliscomenobacter hydrossis DSM 1100]